MKSAAFFLFVGSTALAQPPAGYYDSAYGLSGEPLRQALRDIIDNHSVQQYSALWGLMQSTDDRPDGYVWDIYSDAPGPNEPYLYTFGVDQCGTYTGEGDCFNREHSFPLSWFNDQAPMNSDLFHIYPTDGWVNQKRGSFIYGEVNNPDWTSQNGSKVGPCVGQGCGGQDAFEPIDLYKGDLARTYFYMLTRYMDQTATWPCPMLTGGEFSPWAKSMLYAWHNLDPVDSKEVDRNNSVFAIQQNRNPYIDNPQWVDAIWGPSAGVASAEPYVNRVWATAGQLHRADLSEALVELVDPSGRSLWSGTWPSGSAVLALPALRGLLIARVESSRGLVVCPFYGGN